MRHRQLKIVMERNGDQIHEQDFQQKEMAMRYFDIQNRRDLKLRISERFILCSSKYSNNFAQSWILPIVGLLLSNFIMFNVVTLGALHFALPESSFLFLAADFFDFVSPLHNTKNI